MIPPTTHYSNDPYNKNYNLEEYESYQRGQTWFCLIVGGIMMGVGLSSGNPVLIWGGRVVFGAGFGTAFGEEPPLDKSRRKFDDAPTLQSPLILDLNGNGVETTNFSGGVFIDHNNDGFSEYSTWVESNDGILVFDRNGNNAIDGGNEIFGDNTTLANGQKAAQGFAALADLDTNQDGKINALDASFAQLGVLKGDGTYLTLTELGIKQLNLGYTTNGAFTDVNGNRHAFIGSYELNNGTVRTMTDVYFQTNPMVALQTNVLAVPTDVQALPYLSNFGTLYDLHQAIVRDTDNSLKTLVQQFVSTTDVNTRSQILDNLLFEWAGVQNHDPECTQFFQHPV